jgi:hypothetical protein
MAELSIAAPYRLEPVDEATAAALAAGLSAGRSPRPNDGRLTVRQVTKSGVDAGLLLGMTYPPPTTPSWFLEVMREMSRSSGKDVTTRAILGHDVVVTGFNSTNIAAYLHRSTIVIGFGESSDDAVSVITAVIQATE